MNTDRIAVLKWFGGKFYQLNQLLPFPRHHFYVELFGGGGTVLLNKTPCKFEVYNDINPDLVNFWKTFRSDYHLFRLLTFCLPKSQSFFNDMVNKDYDALIPEFLKPLLKDIDAGKIEDAISFYYRNAYSFSGDNHSFVGLHLDRTKTVPSKIEAIDNFLQRAWLRIRDVQFICRDYRKIIASSDRKHGLIYLDPPYRGAGKAYVTKSENNELWVEEHYHELNQLLKKVENARFVLSIDDASFFDGKGWHVEEIEQVSYASSSKEKEKKTEFIIRNYDPGKTIKMKDNMKLTQFIGGNIS